MNPFLRPLRLILLTVPMVILVSCAIPSPPEELLQVSVLADQQTFEIGVPPGTTIDGVLEELGIEIASLDRVEPPGYTPVTEGMEITIIRVEELFETENAVIPFERQTIQSEILQIGQTQLIQSGKNGLEEVTYRIVFEEGEQRLRIPLKRVVIEDPVPEILMVGVQQSSSPIAFSGKIVLASAGNAWLLEGETGKRRSLMLKGDLDGRVLKLSSDGRWLLFSRKLESAPEDINSLWAINVQDPNAEAIDLDISNVIHFADWSPSSPSQAGNYTIAYTTVEPRSAAPGWQANNDLHLMRMTYAGTVFEDRTVLEPNPGGQYGWWGTNYEWSPDGELLAYARPDSIGIVNPLLGSVEELHPITPYQTRSDWAWVPEIAWSPDQNNLYYVEHGDPIATTQPEVSQVFNLLAHSIQGEYAVPLSEHVGMFSFIAPSTIDYQSSGEISHQLAFLEALFPMESETSHYRLVEMDRDGSNRTVLFPPEGQIAMEPGQFQWSPSGDQLAIMYRQDLWLLDLEWDIQYPVTSDGRTNAFDWKP
ncbi:MAG: hypothetical protein GTO18_02935 [Anaerolineales bacterium]|nr:hypothetical protein [Anaerolineales bacterium]